MLKFAPGREDVGRLTSQNMPFQMLIPGKGLSTIRAKHHFGLLKEKLAGVKRLCTGQSVAGNDDKEEPKLCACDGPWMRDGYGVHQTWGRP
jgi:hypothetical protein